MAWRSSKACVKRGPQLISQLGPHQVCELLRRRAPPGLQVAPRRSQTDARYSSDHRRAR